MSARRNSMNTTTAFVSRVILDLMTAPTSFATPERMTALPSCVMPAPTSTPRDPAMRTKGDPPPPQRRRSHHPSILTFGLYRRREWWPFFYISIIAFD